MRLYFRIRVKGLEHIPKAGPFILLPNHVSTLDAPILALALGRERTLGCSWAGSSKLLFRNTLTRSLSRLAQVVPIERRVRWKILGLTRPSFPLLFQRLSEI